MSTYDYKAGKERVEEILNNSTEVIEQDSIPNDSQFTYENGYYGWVSAIFVDIRDSTTLFQNSDKVKVSKIIRCFTSEIIEILRDDSKLREIGIRGDCVYAIYTTPKQNDEYELADKAFYVNTYLKELNQLLIDRNYPTIRIGIGVATAKELVVKAGRKNTGICNNVWIGEAVTTASNLSSLGGKDNVKTIVFSEGSYNNIIEKLTEEDSNAPSWFTKVFWSLYGTYYSGDIIKTQFSNWISNGMPV
jgi:class 3 adenylate cyclase